MKKYFPILCIRLYHILVLTLTEEAVNSLKTSEVLLTLFVYNLYFGVALRLASN